MTRGNVVMKHGCSNIGFWFVDVRDAAKAHITADFTNNVKGRYLFLVIILI